MALHNFRDLSATVPRMVLLEDEDQKRAHDKAHEMGIGHPCSYDLVPPTFSVPAKFVGRLLMGQECRDAGKIFQVQLAMMDGGEVDVTPIWFVIGYDGDQLVGACAVKNMHAVEAAIEAIPLLGLDPRNSSQRVVSLIVPVQLRAAYAGKVGRRLTIDELRDVATAHGMDVEAVRATIAGLPRGGMVS